MLAELACFEQHCRARFPIDEVIYNCPACGTGLLEVVFKEGHVDAHAWKQASLQASQKYDDKNHAKKRRSASTQASISFCVMA